MSSSQKFNINEDSEQIKHSWCGYRVVIILGSVSAVFLYTVGTIMTALAYKSWDMGVNCTFQDYSVHGGSVLESEVFGYNTPMVVVGPVFMGVGATIIAILLLQWCFCRPAVTHTFSL